jgi:poly-gamma-glutamate capsule biosynthesis protein CapA/YwtB (metallophosphatase superfamily)
MTYERRWQGRRQAVPRREPRIGRRPTRRNTGGAVGGLALLVAVIGAPLLVIAALLGSSPRGSSPQATGTPGGSAAAATASAGAQSASSSASAPAGAILTKVPMVPVVSFWSTDQTITRTELVDALEGRSTRYRNVIVPTADKDQISTRLGVTLAASVKSGSVAQIRAAVRKGALALLRANDVTPAVRALAIDRAQLFGTEHLVSLDAWPLLIDGAGVPAARVDPAGTWTMVAAGDILLDRGVARQVKVLGKGVDFPFDGGTAEITGYTCCSGYGHRVPTYRRTGDRGAMRELLKSANVAMANLESPIDDQFRYHTGGTTFTGDPKLLDGLQRAGLDFVSLANNHIQNAGSDGILETVAELDRRRIAHSGAGKDFAAARKPAILTANGIKIAVLGCDDIGGAWTSGNKVGSRACNRAMTADIAAAKRVADVVVVYPHWGIEYRATPTARQRQWAKDWIAAGADVIIGNHPHWAGAVEQINGKLVFYALGNFVFDQMWQEQTMEGLVLELTFQGSTLRQARLHPTLVIDQSQPNFMDPAGDGQRVLQQVRKASQALLPY